MGSAAYPPVYARHVTGDADIPHRRNGDGRTTGSGTVAASEWAFADCRTKPFPGMPDPTRICLKSGFNPSLLYELVYTAKDPLVLGVGLAATRDIVSFFRHAQADRAAHRIRSPA